MVKAVLSFSPGEYMQDKHSVGRAAQYLPQPIFITSANDPKEIAAAQAIAARVPDDRATFFKPPEGAIHGSSTTHEAKDPKIGRGHVRNPINNAQLVCRLVIATR